MNVMVVVADDVAHEDTKTPKIRSSIGNPAKGLAPFSRPFARTRKLLSSRAASLMDNQEEDEDDITIDASMFAVQEDASSSLSSSGRLERTQSRGSSSTALVVKTVDESEEKKGSPLARLSANVSGFATYLCPQSRDDDEVIKVQTSKTFQMAESGQLKSEQLESGQLESAQLNGHRRVTSDTESVQQFISAGTCGSTPCWTSAASVDSSSHASSSRFGPHRGSGGPCSDMDLKDFRQMLVIDISNILGTPSGPTINSWLWGNSIHKPGRNRPSNRSAVHRAQRRRVQLLWNNWLAQSGIESSRSEFQGLNTPSTTYNPYQSFDHIGTADSSTVEGLFYDSDPEIVCQRRRKNNKRPNFIVTDSSFGSTGHGPCPQAPRASIRRKNPSFGSYDSKSLMQQEHMVNESASSVCQTLDLWNDHAVKDFIRELTLDKITLIWHPVTTPTSLPGPENAATANQEVNYKSPVSVHGWFETGSRLYNNKLIHPKFMWRESYHESRGRLSCRTPDSLDLLNMVRILKPAKIDRTTYPFAKLEHSFTIKSHDDSIYLFEARSREQRDWFVDGLKLVVARLASMVIVGDDQMFAEFFTPWAHSPAMESLSIASQRDVFSEDEDEEEDDDDDDDLSSKPFYVSTTKQDRFALWGQA